MLGLLVVGVGLGAAAAIAWIIAGGSYLAAFALYSLVATSFVLGAAILSYIFSDATPAEPAPPDEALHPAK